MEVIKRRLLVLDGPDGKPVAFFPTDVVMVIPINLPGEKSGIKDEKGVEVAPKATYRPDLSGIMLATVQQPVYAKGTVQETATIINEKIHWAEGGSR